MTKQMNSGDYGPPAHYIRYLDPYAYGPPDDPEDEGQTDFWNLEEHMKLQFGANNTVVITESYSVAGGVAFTEAPADAGAHFFTMFAETYGKPALSWQQRKMEYQMGDGESLWFRLDAEMRLCDPADLETINEVTRINWPDSIIFIGCSKHIEEFQAGFFRSASEVVKKNSRTKWR